MGQVLWECILTDVSHYNILADDLRLPNGWLAFTGNCIPTGKNASDMYLLILDAKGCFTPGCDSLDLGIDDLLGAGGQWGGEVGEDGVGMPVPVNVPAEVLILKFE